MAEWSAQLAGLSAGEQAIQNYSSRLKAISNNIISIDFALRRECAGLVPGVSLRNCAASLSGCSTGASNLASGLKEISRNYRSVEGQLSGVETTAGESPQQQQASDSETGGAEVTWWDALWDGFNWKSLVSKLGPLAGLIPLVPSMFNRTNPFESAKYLNSVMGGVAKALDKWDDVDAVWSNLFGLNKLTKEELAKLGPVQQLKKIVKPAKASDWFSTFGAIITIGSEFLENFGEYQDADGSMSVGRMVGETTVESLYGIGKGIAGAAVVAGAAALAGVSLPAAAVGLAGVAVAWAAEAGIKAAFNIEGPLDEAFSDFICDKASQAGEWIGDRVDDFKDAASDAIDWAGDRLNDAADAIQNGWQRVREGVWCSWTAIFA